MIIAVRFPSTISFSKPPSFNPFRNAISKNKGYPRVLQEYSVQISNLYVHRFRLCFIKLIIFKSNVVPVYHLKTLLPVSGARCCSARQWTLYYLSWQATTLTSDLARRTLRRELRRSTCRCCTSYWTLTHNCIVGFMIIKVNHYIV